MLNNILITGSSGFIGSNLIDYLKKNGAKKIITPSTRLPGTSRDNQNQIYKEWENSFNNIFSCVHIAGVSHVKEKNEKMAKEKFFKINVNGTLELAKIAANKGVKKFIFLSSLKVNGQTSLPGKPFKSFDEPSPADIYASSKLEAEIRLKKISSETGMQLTIIRPPLVYGPKVKGNFLMLQRFVEIGIPLPFKKIDNLRSIVSVENLISLIICCLEASKASNKTFLVSDDHDLSLTDILVELGNATKKKPRLFYFPLSIMSLFSLAIGYNDKLQKLLGNLQVDIEYTKSVLNWCPPLSVKKGFEKCFFK